MLIATVTQETWSQQLANAVDDARELLRRLGLRAEDLDVDLDPAFAVRVPEAYLARMQPGAALDPLLLQVLPLRAENEVAAGYSSDALEEGAATLAPGLIKKYQGRALLIAAPACAVHCRYCFRRSFPYAEHRLGPAATALDSIAADPSISEIILSGGDPLMLKDTQLSRLITRLEGVAHLSRLRIHTRLPVVIPDRVTAKLVDRLRTSRLQPVMVLHINHPNEIDRPLTAALARLADAGVQLLNQSVLLARVNDRVETLKELSEKLFAARVLPYYLHMPDRVTGTQHFAVTDDQAFTLHEALQNTLPGYLVPRLAREVPGAGAKQWLTRELTPAPPHTAQ